MGDVICFVALSSQAALARRLVSPPECNLPNPDGDLAD